MYTIILFQTPEAKEELSKRLKELKNKLKFVRTRIHTFSRLMRKFSLGQDRFARQYWVLPSVGGVIVEGVETSLDQTLQSDFQEGDGAVTATLMDAEAAGISGSQESICETKQELGETSTDVTEAAKSERVLGEINECIAHKKEEEGASCDERGSGDRVAKRKECGLSDVASEKLGSPSEQMAEKVDEMETAPSPSRGDDSGRLSFDKHVHSLTDPVVASGPQEEEEEEARKHSSRYAAITDSVCNEDTSSLDKSVHLVESCDPAVSQTDHNVASASKVSHLEEERATYNADRQSHDMVDTEVGGGAAAAEMQVEALSCQELLEEEDADKNVNMAAASSQLPSAPHSSTRGDIHVHAIETTEDAGESRQSSQVAQVSLGAEECTALASSTTTTVQPSVYAAPRPPSTSSCSPWFSLFPRELCEAVQVAYIDNQAVLVKSTTNHHHVQQQQQQQVQHVIATDAAGHQYIMAAPAPGVGGSTTTPAAAATPQYAYMTADGQIIAAAAGQNQVIQQVTGMSYALVGNTLVQVPQTQYIAVNASGQQFMIAGGAAGQPSANQQAGVQYVALNGGNAAASASVGTIQAAAAAGSQQGQQYVAVVEREGGGQMLVQVGGGSGDQQKATPNAPAQQYIVQTAADVASRNALVATASAQPGSSSEAAGAVGSDGSPQKPQYGIVNSDGSITLIDEETVASYNAAALASSKVTAGSSAVQQQSSDGGRSLESGEQGVKVEIEVPNQYPQVYIKTEVEEEEEGEEQRAELESAQALASKQAAVLEESSSGVSGQTAVVVVEQPDGGAASSVAVKEGVVSGGASVQAMDTSSSDHTVASMQVGNVDAHNYLYVHLYTIVMICGK